MKLVAFGAGRKAGNTEILIKEALMAAEEMGVEVEYVALRDFEIHPCTACNGLCPMAIAGLEACPHKSDDTIFLVNKYLDADGVIVGAPVYSSTPGSQLFAFRDRVFGPKMDPDFMAFKGVPKWAEGRIKARPTALISVGGAIAPAWTSLGIPSLYSTAFSATGAIVDYMDVRSTADYGAAAIDDELVAQAKQLGRNIANAMLTGDQTYVGKEQGCCPSCHFNAMLIDMEKQMATCVTCGTHAHMVIKDGKVVLEYREGEQEETRLQPCGREFHGREIRHVVEHVYGPRKHLVEERMKKYLDYNQHDVKSPYHEAKKAALREQYANK